METCCDSAEFATFFEIDEAKNSIGLLGFVANVAVSQCALYAEFWKKNA